MIDGVSPSDIHPLSFVRSIRTGLASAGHTRTDQPGGEVAGAATAASSAEDPEHDHARFGLALRQFSQILPHIEWLDAPVE